MRAVLLHNPTAGTGGYSKEMLLSALRLAGVPASYRSVKDNGLKEALRQPGKLIVVAGGDGTVRKALTHLPDRSVPIALLPIGTANNIARSLGINSALVELEEIIHRQHLRRFDIGVAQGPWKKRLFVEAVGLGPLARSIDNGKPDGKEKGGVDGLRKGRAMLQKFLGKADVLDLEITVDGQTMTSDVLAVEIVNVAYSGPALPLAPKADPGDGKLEVVRLPANRRDEMVAWLERPQQEPSPLVVSQGRKVVITGRLPHQRIDDEVFDPTDEETTITIELEHEAAKILVPPRQIIRQEEPPERKDKT
jgi:diacylglycerol kinase family enzyme